MELPQSPRFRIKAPLRCDGVGRFDCGEDAESGARLAVRWLPLDANGDAAVRACEKLPLHPTLPRILQTGQVNGSAFVAMDFPEGLLLSARGDERFVLHEVLRMGSELASALARLHAENVVHGELGAESVLLSGGNASLWDIHLVVANRLTDRRGESRLMHNLKRIAPYLAPERVRGAGASKEADVYGLGAILCIAAGAPLPQAHTTLSVVHQVAARSWMPRVPSIVPEPWASVMEAMLAEEPSARPTAEEIVEAFARAPVAPPSTVPELQAVRLPPEMLATAMAMSKKQLEPVPERPSADGAALPDDVTGPTELAQAGPLGNEEGDRTKTVELQAVSAPSVGDDDVPEAGPGDVVNMPPLELRILPDVALTPTISVAPELAAQGARAELPLLMGGRAPYLALAVMAVAIVVLSGVAVSLAARQPAKAIETLAVPATPVPVVPPSALTPTSTVRDFEDDLAPLAVPPRRGSPEPASAAGAKKAPSEMLRPPARADDVLPIEESGARQAL